MNYESPEEIEAQTAREAMTLCESYQQSLMELGYSKKVAGERAADMVNDFLDGK